MIKHSTLYLKNLSLQQINHYIWILTVKQEPHLKPYDEQNLANKVEPQVNIEPAGNDTMITCKLVL